MKKLLTIAVLTLLTCAPIFSQTTDQKGKISYQGSVSLNGYFFGDLGVGLHTSHGVRLSGLYTGISLESIATFSRSINVAAHVKYYAPTAPGWQGFVGLEVGGIVTNPPTEPGVTITPSAGFLYCFKNDMKIEFGPRFMWIINYPLPIIGTSLTFSF